MTHIEIKGATEGNLKNIFLDLPRERLIVFTGLSGSGKSTLAVDVLFQECQRQYLEAIGMQGIRKPQVEAIHNLSPAIQITQSEANRNPRSTVGTQTDIFTALRMVYEKLGERECPHCHKPVSAALCKEETVKVNGEFHVYMDCCHCGQRMDKLTRSHYSFNTREGACPACQGLGKRMSIVKERYVDEALSLEAGAVDNWSLGYKDYQIKALYQAFRHYGVAVQPDTPVSAYSLPQKAILYHGVEHEEVKRYFPDIAPPKTVAAGRFEGVLTVLWRRMAEKGGEAKQVSHYFDSVVCPACQGERLGPLSRQVTVADYRLPQLGLLPLTDLLNWIVALEKRITEAELSLVAPYLLDLQTKLQRIAKVGLGYLSIDRQMITLSGGERQRIKLAAVLDSALTGIIYILDEPTVGLHPRDTEGILTILLQLRDRGNTVLVIEHDPDIMRAADYVVDFGPGSGKHGGEIIGAGTLEELLQEENSVTGRYLAQEREGKRNVRRLRPGSGKFLEVHDADLYNLQHLHVRFPLGCLVAVTGVSGSGKSTLVFDVLAGADANRFSASNRVTGMEQVDQTVLIEQSPITRMSRSNVATYSDVYGEIRKIFAALPKSREQGLSAKHFSFNTPGGRCENCEGMGKVTSNMLFFQDIEVTCPVCGGKQFQDEILAVRYKGNSIKDILRLSVEEALTLFVKQAKIERILRLLLEVGLGYLELGQSLTTLSGGEGQRLKLAKELLDGKGKNSLYLMDEPTTGLHPVDVENFLILLNKMVDAGNTVIIVEHNQQVIQAADWLIDLGPGGGNEGGTIVFTGTPREMAATGTSPTAECLRKQDR